MTTAIRAFLSLTILAIFLTGIQNASGGQFFLYKVEEFANVGDTVPSRTYFANSVAMVKVEPGQCGYTGREPGYEIIARKGFSSNGVPFSYTSSFLKSYDIPPFFHNRVKVTDFASMGPEVVIENNFFAIVSYPRYITPEAISEVDPNFYSQCR